MMVDNNGVLVKIRQTLISGEGHQPDKSHTLVKDRMKQFNVRLRLTAPLLLLARGQEEHRLKSSQAKYWIRMIKAMSFRFLFRDFKVSARSYREQMKKKLSSQIKWLKQFNTKA